MEKRTKYTNPNFLIRCLEEEIGDNITNLKKFVKNARVNITEKEIINYLDGAFSIENPDLKNKIFNNNPNTTLSKNIIFNLPNLDDRFIAGKYLFSPTLLQYFNKYVDILRDKCYILLFLIEKIGNNDTETILKYIENLDICLDDKGRILSSDIERLVAPTIYNLNDLKDKMSKANNPKTYLDTKFPKIFSSDINEMLPKKSLQVFDVTFVGVDGYVPLSNRQFRNMKNVYSASNNMLIKSLI